MKRWLDAFAASIVAKVVIPCVLALPLLALGLAVTLRDLLTARKRYPRNTAQER